MLAITGGKGGTGKTTTTLGLARALADRGHRAVAVDGDWSLPDLGALAGLDRRAPYPDERAAPLAEAPDATPEGADGTVRVLPAPARPADHDPGRVYRALAAAAESGSTVLVDCPAGAAPDAVAPIRAADSVLLVTEACAAALRDAAKTAAVARRLATPVAGTVVTGTAVIPSGVSALLDCPVLATVPRVGSPVLESDRAQATYGEVVAGLYGDRSTGRSCGAV